MSSSPVRLLIIVLIGLLIGIAVRTLSSWEVPLGRTVAGQSGPTDTPLPALTPLPYTPSPSRAIDVPPVRNGTDAERYVRTTDYLGDGSGDLAFTVGGSYPHARAIFVDRPPDSPRGSAAADVLVPLPDRVRGFRDVRAIPGSTELIAGAEHWSEGAGNASAYHRLYRIETISGSAQPLFSPDLRFNDFAVAPDGGALTALTAAGELRWLDLSTGEERTLARGLITPAGVAAANIAWHPEGTEVSLGFHPVAGGASLDRVTVATGRRHRIADFPSGHDPLPVYLDDGQLKVFVHEARADRMAYEVRVFDVLEGDEPDVRFLVSLPAPQVGGYVDSPVAHPDGQRVLYRRDGGLYMLRSDVPGGQPVRLDGGEAVTAGPVLGARGGGTEAAYVVRVPSTTQADDPGAPEYVIRRLMVEEGGGA